MTTTTRVKGGLPPRGPSCWTVPRAPLMSAGRPSLAPSCPGAAARMIRPLRRLGRSRRRAAFRRRTRRPVPDVVEPMWASVFDLAVGVRLTLLTLSALGRRRPWPNVTCTTRAAGQMDAVMRSEKAPLRTPPSLPLPCLERPAPARAGGIDNQPAPGSGTSSTRGRSREFVSVRCTTLVPSKPPVGPAARTRLPAPEPPEIVSCSTGGVRRR